MEVGDANLVVTAHGIGGGDLGDAGGLGVPKLDPLVLRVVDLDLRVDLTRATRHHRGGVTVTSRRPGAATSTADQSSSVGMEIVDVVWGPMRVAWSMVPSGSPDAGRGCGGGDLTATKGGEGRR